MIHREFRSPMLFAFAAVLLLAAPATLHADPPDAKEVTLELSVDAEGYCSITVHPETAVLKKNGKIKKVYWAALPNDHYPQLFWELRWDPDKGGGSENYFGDVDLSCGEDSIKVQPDKPKIENAEWPYAVTVFDCVDGVKAEELCTVDPRIRWQN